MPSQSFDSKGGWLSHQKSHKKENIVDVDEAKPKKEKEPVLESAVPSDYDRLKMLLTSFGIPNHAGIIEGMKFHQIDDINALKDLLRSVSAPQGKTEAISKIWAEIQGKKNSRTRAYKKTGCL